MYMPVYLSETSSYRRPKLRSTSPSSQRTTCRKRIPTPLKIVAQACKTGFMESELVRARDEMLANYEKAYNERNNTKTENLAREIIRHFVDNEPSPGIEKEYEIVKQILPAIPVQALNQMLPAADHQREPGDYSDRTHKGREWSRWRRPRL